MNPKIWISFNILIYLLIYRVSSFILPQNGSLAHYNGTISANLLNPAGNNRTSKPERKFFMDSSDFKQKFTSRIKSHTHRLYSSHHPVVKADLKNNFVDIWKENLGTITLGTIYGIKILKLLIYIRYLLEWLPQVNPYLPPFDTIYQTTDAYLKVFQLFLPRVAGVDTSGIIAWFILENIEAFLSTKPEIANSLQ